MLQKQPVHVMDIHQRSLGGEGSAFECAHIVDRALYAYTYEDLEV